MTTDLLATKLDCRLPLSPPPLVFNETSASGVPSTPDGDSARKSFGD
jgi:hypothetical protein